MGCIPFGSSVEGNNTELFSPAIFSNEMQYLFLFSEFGRAHTIQYEFLFYVLDTKLLFAERMLFSFATKKSFRLLSTCSYILNILISLICFYVFLLFLLLFLPFVFLLAFSIRSAFYVYDKRYFAPQTNLYEIRFPKTKTIILAQ